MTLPPPVISSEILETLSQIFLPSYLPWRGSNCVAVYRADKQEAALARSSFIWTSAVDFLRWSTLETPNPAINRGLRCFPFLFSCWRTLWMPSNFFNFFNLSLSVSLSFPLSALWKGLEQHWHRRRRPPRRRASLTASPANPLRQLRGDIRNQSPPVQTQRIC